MIENETNLYEVFKVPIEDFNHDICTKSSSVRHSFDEVRNKELIGEFQALEQ